MYNIAQERKHVVKTMILAAILSLCSEQTVGSFSCAAMARLEERRLGWASYDVLTHQLAKLPDLATVLFSAVKEGLHGGFRALGKQRMTVVLRLLPGDRRWHYKLRDSSKICGVHDCCGIRKRRFMLHHGITNCTTAGKLVDLECTIGRANSFSSQPCLTSCHWWRSPTRRDPGCERAASRGLRRA